MIVPPKWNPMHPPKIKRPSEKIPVWGERELKSVGPHTFVDKDGEELDSDDVQWHCPKCRAQYNEAGRPCENCGYKAPNKIVREFSSKKSSCLLRGVSSFVRRMAFRVLMAMKNLTSLTDLVAEEIRGYLNIGFRKEVYEKVEIPKLLYSVITGITGDEGEVDEDMPDETGYNREAISRMVIEECGFKFMTKDYLDKKYKMEEREKGKVKEEFERVEELKEEGLEDLAFSDQLFRRGYGPDMHDKLMSVARNQFPEIEEVTEDPSEYRNLAEKLLGKETLDAREKKILKTIQPDLTKSLAFAMLGVFKNVRATVLKRVGEHQRGMSQKDEQHIDPAFKKHTELPGGVTLAEVEKYVAKYYDVAHQMAYENAVSKNPHSEKDLAKEIKEETGKDVTQQTINNWTETMMKDLHERFFSKVNREKKLDVRTTMVLHSLSPEDLKDFEGYVERQLKDKQESQEGQRGRKITNEMIEKLIKLLGALSVKDPKEREYKAVAEKMGVSPSWVTFYVNALKDLYPKWQETLKKKLSFYHIDELERVMAIVSSHEGDRVAREAIRKALGHEIPVEPVNYDSLESKGLVEAQDYDSIDRPIDYDNLHEGAAAKLTPEEIEKNRDELLHKKEEPKEPSVEKNIDEAFDAITDKANKEKARASELKQTLEKWVNDRILKASKFTIIPQFHVDYDWETAATSKKDPERDKDGKWVNDNPHFAWAAYRARIGTEEGGPLLMKRGTTVYHVRYDYTHHLTPDGAPSGKAVSNFSLEKDSKEGKVMVINEMGASDFKQFLDDYFSNLLGTGNVPVPLGKNLPVVYEWIEGDKKIKEYMGTTTFQRLLGGLGFSGPGHKQIAKDYDLFVENREKHRSGHGWVAPKKGDVDELKNILRNIKRNEKATKEEQGKAMEYIALLRDENLPEIKIKEIDKFIHEHDRRRSEERKKIKIKDWDPEEVPEETKREQVTVKKEEAPQ